ncbi:MAG: SagB/ThcOx family dehydrogenase [Myxococcota bacterium]
MQATSYHPDEMQEHWAGRSYDPQKSPPTYLTYENALDTVALGEPNFPEAPDLWSVMAQRRAKRNFLPIPLSLNELNVLCWSASGITADMGGYQLRTAPSSGALYPTETYLVVNRVEGLQPGLYHLNVLDWTLEALRYGDLSDVTCEALLGQEMSRRAGVNFIWTSVIERCRAKYYERAYRYIWWDVGHMSENLLLAATALKLGACPMGAWYDGLVHELLGIDGTEHMSVLTASVGHVEGRDWRADRRISSKG